MTSEGEIITGKIQTRTWDDTEGKKHYATDVIVDEAEFVESKKGQEQDEEISLPSNDDTEDIFK
jgi:single-strand DNA-binding protein